MITYNYFGKEQKIFYEKLENGLDVYVIPNKNLKNYHAEFVVRYGSTTKSFKPINGKRYIDIPMGTAHFLEHKVFESEDVNPFEFFSKSGVFANASTSYDNTRYYIEGKKNFKANFEYLTTMVFTPYFTDELVNKEQGIIKEEIKMYEDQVEWNLDEFTRGNLTNTSYKDSIAGTVDSIKKITPELLSKIYDTFYQPSNMFLIVSGNVSYKRIIDILNNNVALKSRKTNYPIAIKSIKDTKKVIKEYGILKKDIIIPKLKYSFKFDLNTFDIKDKVILKMYLNLIIGALFSEGSDFEDKIIKEKKATYFYHEHFVWDDIYVLSFNAESEYADLLVDEIDKIVNNIQIDEQEFLRIKRIWYSIIIRSIDSQGSIADSISDDILEDEKVIDYYELINHLKYDEMMKVIKKMDFSNKSLTLVLPKDK